jgi:hypothetical protein
MQALRHEIDSGDAVGWKPAPLVPAASARLSRLRQLLAEKFPAAERKPGGLWTTGLAALDAAEGGLRRGALTEISSSPANGALFIDVILRSVVRGGAFAALVDAGGTFDPDSFDAGMLLRLLWVRCTDVSAAMKAADLLLRDGNLPILLLDLQRITRAQLGRKSPASTWHRFQRLAEQTSVACLILTRQPLVESAQVRIALQRRWTLAAQRQRRSELAAGLKAQVIPRRAAGQGLSVVGAPVDCGSPLPLWDCRIADGAEQKSGCRVAEDSPCCVPRSSGAFPKRQRAAAVQKSAPAAR